MKNYWLIRESIPDYDRDPVKKDFVMIGQCANDTEALKKGREISQRLNLGACAMSLFVVSEVARLEVS